MPHLQTLWLVAACVRVWTSWFSRDEDGEVKTHLHGQKATQIQQILPGLHLLTNLSASLSV